MAMHMLLKACTPERSYIWHRQLMLSSWPADKLSPFKFYQYLLGNVPDTDIIKFLKMLTFLPLDQIWAVSTMLLSAFFLAQ